MGSSGCGWGGRAASLGDGAGDTCKPLENSVHCPQKRPGGGAPGWLSRLDVRLPISGSPSQGCGFRPPRWAPCWAWGLLQKKKKKKESRRGKSDTQDFMRIKKFCASIRGRQQENEKTAPRMGDNRCKSRQDSIVPNIETATANKPAKARMGRGPGQTLPRRRHTDGREDAPPGRRGRCQTSVRRHSTPSRVVVV